MFGGWRCMSLLLLLLLLLAEFVRQAGVVKGQEH